MTTSHRGRIPGGVVDHVNRVGHELAHRRADIHRVATASGTASGLPCHFTDTVPVLDHVAIIARVRKGLLCACLQGSRFHHLLEIRQPASP